MVSDNSDLEQLDSPALVGPYSTATSPYSIPPDFPAYTQIISLDCVNELLLEKPDRNWDRIPSIASSSPSPLRPETPLVLPVLDEGFHLKSARGQAQWAAHNIEVCGGNTEDLRARIDSKPYWETEALYYTALLRNHPHRVTDVAAYWQQEAARQKEILALRVSLAKYHAGDHPEDTRTHRNEDVDCIPERREALYYTAILHKNLDRAVDAVSYWKEEAAYQRGALTQWVPSLEDGWISLRYSIDQLEYWREESRYLREISQKLVENHRREAELRKSND